MINQYINSIPKTYFGKRSLGTLQEFVKKKTLVIFSKSLEGSEEYEKIVSQFEEGDLKTFNPKEYTIQEVDKLSLTSNDVDQIIAFGGGSIMDFSKLVRLKIDNPEVNLSEVNLQTKLTKKTNLIVIPSTPSTGSQVTSVATINFNSEKKIILNENNIPDLVILNPKVLSSITQKSMAEFISDIFAHSFESYVSRLTNDFVQNLAIQNTKDLVKNWANYKALGGDLGSLEKISINGQIGGICQGNAFVGVMHALAHQIESINGLGHSKILLNIIGPVLEWYRKTTGKEIYDEFLRLFNELSLDGFKEDVFFGIDLSNLVERVLLDPSIKTSPVIFNKENLEDLIKWILTKK